MHISLSSLLLESDTLKVSDNPNFKKWFSNSIVVDDSSGKPLKVFHGTTSNKNFDIFNTTLRGAWFTANPSEASAYTIGYSKFGSLIQRPDYIKKYGRVLPVYLSIQNPKIYTSNDLDTFIDNWSRKENYKEHFKEIIASTKKEGYDGLLFKSSMPNRDIYVAFASNQIKSIFNNGNFDSGSSDITK